MKYLKNLLKLSHVPRWAIIDTTKSQSVADHTFRVMAIGMELMKHSRLADRIDAGVFLMTAMDHDIDESWTGDIPSPYKNKKIPESVSDLNDTELLIKLADLIEAIIYLDRYGIRSQYIREGLRGQLGQWMLLATKQWPEDKRNLALKINAIIEEGNRYE